MIVKKPRKQAYQVGSVGLVMVLFMSMLLLMPVVMKFVTISREATGQQLTKGVQAENVARAGLTEAVEWFRRQPIQPVRSSVDPIAYPYPDAAFHPRTSTNVFQSDTIDETIGLVKEFPLLQNRKIWGRFEVKRQKDTNSFPYDPSSVHDISEKRIEGASAGEGLAWYVESVGYVYRRNKGGIPYNQEPNEVIGRARVSTEVRRLAITLPANAAAIVTNRDNTTVQNNGKILGDTSLGLAYYTGSSGPNVSGTGSEVSGTPGSGLWDVDGPSAHGALTPQTIFGVSQTELRLMSDVVVSNASEIGTEYPPLAVVYISSHAVFGSSQPLRGGGILYVDGDLTVTSESNTLFSGFIYVTGDCLIEGPAVISGAVAVEGDLTVDGDGDVAEIVYDSSILNSVRQQVAQYRENRAMIYAFSAAK